MNVKGYSVDVKGYIVDVKGYSQGWHICWVAKEYVQNTFKIQ